MINGRLFTRDFLLQGIQETDGWKSITPAELDQFRMDAKKLLDALSARKSPNEAQTEDDLVYPLLERLGWDDREVQPNVSKKSRKDVPDALLFPDAAAKATAGQLAQWQRFQHGLCVVEAKKWQRLLDREVNGSTDDKGTPSSQILRYLRRIEEHTHGKLKWGVLTNGRVWRLYFQGAASVAEDYFEVDLGKTLSVVGCDPELLDKRPDLFKTDIAWNDHVTKLFLLLFRKSAFQPINNGETFHTLALNEGKQWESKVAKTLSEKVFGEVFPALSDALAKADPKRPAARDAAYLELIRHGALIFLYRLLFVLYAEDRNLLPDESGPYAKHCLTKIRKEVAADKEAGSVHPSGVVSIWPRLQTIFKAIADGNDGLGIPPYNGGLFDGAAAPILNIVQLDDATLAKIILALSHEPDDGSGRGLRYINYRDLSVQQLGSVYERLLEHQLRVEGQNVVVALNAFGRKSSGSYYTPDELVQLIIERTIGPLVQEAEETFREAAESNAKDDKLATVDPAEAILRLKVCDPAIGSGHFLVSLVDWMTDRALAAMAQAEILVDGYHSPVVKRIETIRERILQKAKEHNWPIVESHLDNRQVVRRMILKRCVYGVDLNPMAVELAKVALWLHSFTVGAPLSFLDHHLICGNALFGERVRPVMDWAMSGNLLINDLVQKARSSSKGMEQVEELTDADIAEARNSKSLYAAVEDVTADLRTFMDLAHGVRWADNGGRVKSRAINRLQRGDFGDPIKLLKGVLLPPAVSKEQSKLLAGHFEGPRASATERRALADAEDREAVPQILSDVRTALGRERFLHWEVAFPGVWQDWESNDPKGGFDAVIGNPPWDRMKFQEVEWFAERKPEIATATRAADRRRMVDELLQSNDPIVADYNAALARAEGSALVARACGEYPLLSGGDVNLYSLFVERALHLLQPNGILGLLTPSGIASDKSASGFFRSISTTGRLGCLFDFENRRGESEPFFPDVDSRFKFSVLVVGGTKRKFARAACAFFLQSPAWLAEPGRAFTLTPQDFAKVNPNTGTAPIFRSKRDAEITKSIYDRLPVLVNHAGVTEVSTYPVRFSTMFHMTNDSNLFVTKAELEKSAYPIGGGRWRKGTAEFVPLLVGRSIRQYDHRAASVLVNDENLHNAASSGETTVQQHIDPDFIPTPQYWVSRGAIDWPPDQPAVLAFRDIARPTDVRTMISALVPFSGAGNKLPLLMPKIPESGKAAKAQAIAEYKDGLPLLLGNFNSIVFDFVARQKVHSANLNWFIVEQLPVVPPQNYQRMFGTKTAEEIVKGEVLSLTYTSHDMAPFAESMGFVEASSGKVKPPVAWDEMDRLRRRAKLDALYFMLYFPSGTSAEVQELRDMARYIYSTFPIVEREEQAAHGRFVSRDLCLNYINALAAADPDAVIVV